jgi:hypothetical protein
VSASVEPRTLPKDLDGNIIRGGNVQSWLRPKTWPSSYVNRENWRDRIEGRRRRPPKKWRYEE